MNPYSLDYTRHSQDQQYNTARISSGLEASSSRTASTSYIYGRGNNAYTSSWAGTSPVEERPTRKLDRPWENGNDIKGLGQPPTPAQQPPQQQQQQQQQSSQSGVFPSSGPTAKRGSRACMACRRGKNRCEWDPAGKETSCRRCLMNGTQCVFEKPAEKSGTRARTNSAVADLPSEAENRITSLETMVETLSSGQTQMQTTLQQILTLLPQTQSLLTPTGGHPTFLSQNTPSTGVPPSTIFPSVSPPQTFHDAAGMSNVRDNAQPERPRSPQNTATGRGRSSSTMNRVNSMKEFPPLPGFAPPNHRFGTYGIIPLPSAPPSPSRSRHSSRSSSSSRSRDEYSSALPHETLTAPIQALQALANAADQAAALVDKDDEGEKGKSVSQEVSSDGGDEGSRREEGGVKKGAGRQWKISGENDEDRGRSRKRKRVTVDGQNIHLKVRKKTRPDPTPRNPFPDVVTKGLVSEEEARELWDIHALRMGLDINLHKALDKLANKEEKRTEAEERDLVNSPAELALGPVNQYYYAMILRGHPMASDTDMRLIAGVELVNIRSMPLFSVRYGWRLHSASRFEVVLGISAILYPTSLSIPLLVTQVSELAHCLSAECFAERYALTLRLMLSNFRRATGALSTIPGTPRMAVSTAAGAVHGLSGLSMTPLNVNGQMNDVEGSFQSFLSLPQMENHSMDVGGEGENEDHGAGATGFGGTEGDGGIWDMMGLEGFDWPTELSPSSMPVWLREGVGVFVSAMI
ncbi:hypothetical protein I307_03733 [Cryptococcus deuterogattii 99/473]|uniref:Zn(2)-C6 fungal-type domain-containing protein n=1 Tax=Cryptococcus deuterogattii Ram5 TaxID=1296110 RepID=A0A0D0TAW9_9TREE|nr:hypothetical protein I352_00027 [Cryptococcus deuterogattii MMRL2647]KIR43187.1 hypothetical protein I313_00028 [Cryptococcus deuterogattii Ram5]KIY56995.1 hypothetical protein I307_03733 [Cryptococcus deuterogattii 99/473]